MTIQAGSMPMCFKANANIMGAVIKCNNGWDLQASGKLSLKLKAQPHVCFGFFAGLMLKAEKHTPVYSSDSNDNDWCQQAPQSGFKGWNYCGKPGLRLTGAITAGVNAGCDFGAFKVMLTIEVEGKVVLPSLGNTDRFDFMPSITAKLDVKILGIIRIYGTVKLAGRFLDLLNTHDRPSNVKRNNLCATGSLTVQISFIKAKAKFDKTCVELRRGGMLSENESARRGMVTLTKKLASNVKPHPADAMDHWLR